MTAARVVPLLGPALVAGVAYLDPGNVAANITAGARFGYLLLWVVILGNLVAWLVQYLSAKLGLATGKSLTQILGERFRSPWSRRLFWLQAEIVAMATDLAEIVGGAVALNLLFGTPLLAGGLLMGVLSLALLWVRGRSGVTVFERIIIALLVVILLGFGIGLSVNPPDAMGVVGGFVPRFDGTLSVVLAASILGATVMPHAIYAHSALVRDRFGQVSAGVQRTLIMRATRVDVTVALIVAGAVNVALLLIGAINFPSMSAPATLENVYLGLRSSLGIFVAVGFAIALLASSLASTSVGAYAGAEMMSGLVSVRIPILWRRVITLIPALIVLAAGLDPTMALIVSQVVLSFGIPFALVPLITLTKNPVVVGELANKKWTTAIAWLAAIVVSLVNVALILLTVL